jgi:alpha-aminoadipate carrier protein LysW
MSINCTDCGRVIELTNEVSVGEIIECPDCGLEYVATEIENGQLALKELTLKGEDWGE